MCALFDITPARFLLSAVLRLQKNDIRWEMEPSFAEWLERVLASPGAPVKASQVKTVTEHRVGERRYFVKRYLHHAVALRPLKYFFKNSQARQEWILARELEARHIPIVRHVALGERWSWRGLLESILVTEAFDGVQVDQASQYDAGRLLQFVLGCTSKACCRDLHLANILVDEASGEFRLVDLHGTEIRSVLSREERNQNLAFLRIFAPIPVSPEIERLSRQLRKTAFAERSARCLKRNREFGNLLLGDRRWQVRLPLLNGAAQRILAEPDDVFSQRALLLKDGQSSTVGRADGFVLKRYNFRKWGNLAKDLFRSSKARRAFHKAYHLELAGIPTARPVATAEDRWLILLRSYFLMEEIGGGVQLQKCPCDDPVSLGTSLIFSPGFTMRDFIIAI